ncbi:putative surface protein with fasciclin (FAS1) repeats [Kordia periserrulae]|uniref:Putative surface protein with fasciclin (FAS1) repeats n=1 Tax=Kordia periserrulae TaxID=701523 RepID=A0A2T6BQN3_9FLAO|nr:fasciclin domain-containing protein [Kordia periserrulae]PTX58378.1 putative surface protein with fasciclin (FAS1) repeats [Kordia periserrulae]
MKKLILTITTIAIFAFATQTTAQNQDVVDIAASNKSFSTLVTAVKAAGLVDALKGEGPFTVFAPTNDAFGKIDQNTLSALLKPENKSKLTAVLTYHVIKGKLTASDVVAALKKGKGKVTLTTLSGSKITVVQNDKGIWLKDANGNYSMISKTDIMASNGVIHVIDTVVMP